MVEKSSAEKILELIIAIFALIYGLAFVSAIVGVFLVMPSFNIFLNLKNGTTSQKQVISILKTNFYLLFFFVILFLIIGSDFGDYSLYYAAFFIGILFLIPILLSLLYLKIRRT